MFAKTSGGVDGLYLERNTVARCGGNCVALGASNMHIRHSVFLRDTPEMLFLYGTTDVIIGTVSGNNSITDTVRPTVAMGAAIASSNTHTRHAVPRFAHTHADHALTGLQHPRRDAARAGRLRS